MPNQKVSFKNGEVIVGVYVEKPRKKRPSSNEHHHHHHHHHHYHVHHTFRRELIIGSASNGYNRRAELLKYSQSLRESARAGAAQSTPPLVRQISNINRKSNNQIDPSPRKAKYDAGRAGCFGNWKLLIPSCIRSWTAGAKSKGRKKKRMHSSGWSSKQITNTMKKFKVKGKRNSISSVFSTTRKPS